VRDSHSVSIEPGQDDVIILPILFVALWKSGDTERRIVREQLKGESETIITPDE
jgi:hypothetical protein